MANKINAVISLASVGISNVVADVRKVTDAVNKSVNAVDKLRLKMKPAFDSVKKFSTASAMGFSALAGGASLAVRSVIGLADGVATRLDSLSKFSRNVGLSATQLQKWHYAAERSGMSTDQFNNSIKKFSSNVSKAVNGEKKQLDLFNALGISLRKTNGEVKGNNELMLELAEAYDKISNAQDKVRITEELFGKGSVGMNTLFEGGAGGIRDLLARREKLGLMFTEEDAKNAEGFKDILLDVTTITDGIKNKFVAEMIPSLNQGMDEFIKIWEKDGLSIMDKVKTAADVIGYAFIDGVKLLGDWSRMIDQIGSGFEITGNDIKFVINELWGELKKLVDWWEGVPIIGDVISLGKSIFGGSGKNDVAPPQVSSPQAVNTTRNYTENRNTTTTSKVLIDVSGNKDTQVDVDEAFTNDRNVDLGWTFAF